MQEMFCWQQLDQHPVIFIQSGSTAQHPAHTFERRMPGFFFYILILVKPVIEDAEMVRVKNSHLSKPWQDLHIWCQLNTKQFGGFIHGARMCVRGECGTEKPP